MRICDTCKQEPIPFKVEDPNNLMQEDVYFFRVEENGDPVTLMSDGSYVFCFITDKDIEPKEGYLHVCGNCMDIHLQNINYEE